MATKADLCFKFSHEVTQRFYTVNGKNVRSIREVMHLSRHELAIRCGWSLSWMQEIEANTAFQLSEASVKILAGVLRIDWADVDAPEKIARKNDTK
jgi:transcriptional regulator with XRE-family HTH domain